MILLKIIVLVSAAAALVCRFIASKYAASFTPGTVEALNIAGYIACGVLLVSGLIWALIERKKAKTVPAARENAGAEDENGQKTEENP